MGTEKKTSKINPEKIPFWSKDGKKTIKNYSVTTDVLLLNKTYQSLKPRTKNVYDAMRVMCRGRRTFTFSISCYMTLGFSKSTVKDAVDELVAKGFITKKTYYGGRPTEYTFCRLWQSE